MGYGDELMAVGEARELNRATGRKVLIGRSLKHQACSPMFDNVPWLVPHEAPVGDAILLCNVPGQRPYLDHQNCTKQRMRFTCHRATAGDLFFTDAEKQWAKGRLEPGTILIEPHVKGTFSAMNKAWPWGHWVRLVEMLSQPVVQISPPGKETLPGVTRAPETENVRQALALLATARLVVASEGLMHHAAAALGMPAVVLWGDRTSPDVVGYETHRNVTAYDSDRSIWCGARKPCDHCAEAMDSIRPETVAAQVRAAYGRI